VRHVAERVNASTKVIYTYFGSKDGLLNELYLESFAGLEAAMDRVTARSPEERLAAMCSAYREYGKDDPARYNVMFGDLGRAYEAPAESRIRAWASFTVLRSALEECLPEDSRGTAGKTTKILWATMHGVVSLELRDLFGPSINVTEIFNSAVAGVIENAGINLGKGFQS
jgi:AcrR family transcriptional regulator